VVEREGAAGGWVGAPDFDAGAGGAEGGHSCGLVCVFLGGFEEWAKFRLGWRRVRSGV
jgi:hypothetical protein